LKEPGVIYFIGRAAAAVGVARTIIKGDHLRIRMGLQPSCEAAYLAVRQQLITRPTSLSPTITIMEVT